MSNEDTPAPKLTVNAPFASEKVASETVPVPEEPRIPSFMTAAPHLPQGYGEQIVETAATMAHVAPRTPEPAAPQPAVAPEIQDRTQPVFAQPQPVEETSVENAPVFDAPRHLEAAYAEETAPVAAAPTTMQAVQPQAPVLQPVEQTAQAAPVDPSVAEKPAKALPFLAALSTVPPKYFYGGLAAAIAVLSIGLFAIPMDDTNPVQTAATTQSDEGGADLRNLASKVDVTVTNAELTDRTNGALTILGVEVKQPLSASATLSGSSLMRDISEQIVTDLARHVPQEGQDSPTAQGDLAGLIAQAIATDQSDAVLRAIITDAINNNQLTVPGGLVNSEGEIDTATLVDALMQITAEGSAVDPDYELPPQRTYIDGDTLVHLVVPGESLASISLRYYGNTFDYPRIFAANTDKLASPDQIRTGQRLVIPQ